jgi:glycosyltransferase involved in cell wall biosynthesis
MVVSSTQSQPRNPRVSIGLPVFNGERYLKFALDSILAQTFGDFELIVCDNASTDATQTIALEFASRDPRIRYHRNDTNLGVNANHNLSFDLAKGEYFRWAGSDDICAPTMLEKYVQFLDGHPDYILCYGRTQLIDENGSLLKEYDDGLDLQFDRPSKRLSQLLYQLRMVNVTYGLIRATALRKTDLFPNYPSSDSVLLAQMAMLGRFCQIPELLFSRRVHSQMTVQKHQSLHERALWLDPKLEGRLIFPHWNILGHYLGSIWKASMSPRERLECYLRIVIWVRRYRSDLAGDLSWAFRHLSGGASQRANDRSESA